MDKRRDDLCADENSGVLNGGCAELEASLKEHVDRVAEAYGFSKPYSERLVQSRARDIAAYFNASPPLSGAVDALTTDPAQSAIPQIAEMTQDQLIDAARARWFDGNPVSSDAVVDPVRAREFAEIAKRLGKTKMKRSNPILGKTKMKAVKPNIGEGETSADPKEVADLEAMAPFLLDVVKAMSDFTNFFEMQTALANPLTEMFTRNANFMLSTMLNLSRLRGQLRLDKNGKRLEYPHPHARMVDQLLGEVLKNLPSRQSVMSFDWVPKIQKSQYGTKKFVRKLDDAHDVREPLSKLGDLRSMQQIYQDFAERYGAKFPGMQGKADATLKLINKGAKIFKKAWYGGHSGLLGLGEETERMLAGARHGYFDALGWAYKSLDPFQEVQGDRAQAYLKDLFATLDRIFPSANVVWTDKIVDAKADPPPVDATESDFAKWWETATEAGNVLAFVNSHMGAEDFVVPIRNPKVTKVGTANSTFHEMIHVMLARGYFTSEELETLLDEVGPGTKIFKKQGVSDSFYRKSVWSEESLTFYLGQELAKRFATEHNYAKQISKEDADFSGAWKVKTKREPLQENKNTYRDMVDANQTHPTPVSYTHLTLPTKA